MGPAAPGTLLRLEFPRTARRILVQHRVRLRWWVVAASAVTAARLLFLLTTRDDPVFRVPYLDGAFYHAWARSLAEGRGDFQGPYFLGPLYPHFLALLYRMFGPEPMAVRVVQAALGIADALLVFALAQRLCGRTAATAAVALFALYGPLVFYENLLVVDPLLLGLALGALGALVLPSWRTEARGALAGFLLGLATLGRPTALLLAPCLVFAPWGRVGRRRGLVACASVWVLVLLPVAARNARLGGGLAITTNGGVNFFAGNAPGATGRFREPPGVRFFASPVLEPGAVNGALPPAVAERALTVRAVAGTEAAADSRRWTGAAWAWMRAHPLDAAVLQLRKMWLLLQAREVPQIESYSFHARRLPALRGWFVDFGWLWPLAALGLWRMRRDRAPGAGLVAAFAAALLLPCVLFFVTARHRSVALPEVACLAGCGAATLVEWVRCGSVRRVAMALAAVAPLAIGARLGGRPPRGAAGWEHAQMAERLYALGDLDGAIREQEQAGAVLPDRYEVPLNLALYWSERGAPGDLGRAERLLRELVVEHPTEAVIQFNLGVVLEQAGKVEEAVACWRETLRLEPRFEPARSQLSRHGAAPNTAAGP